MDSPALRIPDHVVSREVGDETVILNLKSGTYFGLNTVGARIWSGLTAEVPPAGIQAAIVTEFEVTAGTAGQDMAELIQQLVANGLLEQG